MEGNYIKGSDGGLKEVVWKRRRLGKKGRDGNGGAIPAPIIIAIPVIVSFPLVLGLS